MHGQPEAVPFRRLFSLPTEVKQQYPLDPAKNIGWEWQSQVRPSTGFPDQKESMCASSAAPFLTLPHALCLHRHWHRELPRHTTALTLLNSIAEYDI